MLPPDGESDRFPTTKVLKLVGHRRGIFVFCYVVGNGRQLSLGRNASTYNANRQCGCGAICALPS